MESASAASVVEETPIIKQKEPEMPIQQDPAIAKDEEEPMEQEEADPMIQEEIVDSISKVTSWNRVNKIEWILRICYMCITGGNIVKNFKTSIYAITFLQVDSVKEAEILAPHLEPAEEPMTESQPEPSNHQEPVKEAEANITGPEAGSGSEDVD